MDVRWDTFTLPNGRTRPQILVSERSDWGLFDRVACRLEEDLEGRWSERLDGLDERYWDLETGHGRLTLHLQHFLGITLYAADASPESESHALLEAAFEVLVSHGPA